MFLDVSVNAKEFKNWFVALLASSETSFEKFSTENNKAIAAGLWCD